MNESVSLLCNIAQKPSKLAIGLMSGTSLDGLDIVLCEITDTGADTGITLREFRTVSYPGEIIAELKGVASAKHISQQQLCLMHTWLGDYFADMVEESLREWEIDPLDIDFIASHGQTVYHAPAAHHQQENRPNATLQIGDGDHIARRTGILTVSDFRQKHTAAGGEGAPMVALTDEMLYRTEQETRLLLNIGGIANFTYLPAGEDQEMVTTDVGPGNTLINHKMEELYSEPFDEGGEKACMGAVQPELLKVLENDSFFSQAMPRTTGPELFNGDWLQQKYEEARQPAMAEEDWIATLTWFTAQTIADAIADVSNEVLPEVYVSGGGMHNTQLVSWLERLLDQPVHSFAEIGFDPDAKEAVCFAVLANEMLSGKAFTINPKKNAGRSVNFGKISLPV